MTDCLSVRCVVGSVAVMAVACGHTDLRRNAPGVAHIDLPPQDITSPRVERPGDPGEQMLTLSYAGIAAAGVGVGGAPDEMRPSGTLGFETAIRYGRQATSHVEQAILPPMVPFRAGIGAGWETLVADAGQDGPLGPTYGELQFAYDVVYCGVGWGVDPDDAEHGPQATLAAGPFVFRASHRGDLGSRFMLGLRLGGFHSWVWNR